MGVGLTLLVSAVETTAETRQSPVQCARDADGVVGQRGKGEATETQTADKEALGHSRSAWIFGNNCIPNTC